MPALQSPACFDVVGLGWNCGVCILRRTSACLFSLAKIDLWPYVEMRHSWNIEIRIVVVELFMGPVEFEGRAQDQSPWGTGSIHLTVWVAQHSMWIVLCRGLVRQLLVELSACMWTILTGIVSNRTLTFCFLSRLGSTG